MLELQQEIADITYGETETHPELQDEQHTVWLAFDATRGYLLYLDGNELRLDEASTSTAQTNPTNTPYYEEFESNIVAWEEGDDASFDSEIDNGVYHIEFDEDSDYLNWVVAPGFSNWDLAPQFDGVYTYQLDIRVSCEGFCLVGMGFGIDEGYQGGTFVYYGDGTYLVHDSYLGASLDEGETNERIDIYDDEWHRLRLEIRRGAFHLFIDGESMGEIRAEADITGTIGFQMLREDKNVEIEMDVDNIIVE